MGAPSSLSLSALSLYALFLVWVSKPHQSYGFTGGIAVAPPSDGICATAVVIHGYKCQEFEVITDDGYILSMQRIPQGRAGGNVNNKQPVLLQHGILADGYTWVSNSPDESLGMILADSGFDVWIANGRGTKHSRRHVTLNPTYSEYWDWTWDELAEYDLPAVIDFVFNQTGKKLDYVGHSQGTLMAMLLFSQRKQIDKVNAVALLSPIAYMTNAPATLVAKFLLTQIAISFGLPEFNPRSRMVIDYLQGLCTQKQYNCYDLVTMLSGPNCCLNGSTINLVMEHEPQSTATKNLKHFTQIVHDGQIRKYDYGSMVLNMLKYGQTTPPVYDVSAIPNNLPLLLSYGGFDALSDVEDVQILLDKLKLHDPDKLSVQFVKEYAHLDFIFAVNAKDVVYSQVIEFFRKHHRSSDIQNASC
ncbi:sterol esterase [Sarracenia purpurea var. burkii]